jgi:prohibitin 2
LKYKANASAASNDLQEVATVIALNYHIDPSKANLIYQQLGADYESRIIAPTIQESVSQSKRCKVQCRRTYYKERGQKLL